MEAISADSLVAETENEMSKTKMYVTHPGPARPAVSEELRRDSVVLRRNPIDKVILIVTS
jgi:hypothetical protein